MYAARTQVEDGSPRCPCPGRGLSAGGLPPRAPTLRCPAPWDGEGVFVAKSAEIASAGVAGKGGMPGGFLAITSNGANPNTGIVWTLAPISGHANKHVVPGIL